MTVYLNAYVVNVLFMGCIKNIMQINNNIEYFSLIFNLGFKYKKTIHLIVEEMKKFNKDNKVNKLL